MPLGLVGLAVAYYLLFIFFAVHLLFVDDKINESGPLFDSGVVATPEPTAASGSGSGSTTEDSVQSGVADAPEAANPTSSQLDSVDAGSGALADAEANLGASAASGAEETSASPQVVRLVEGVFIDRNHPTEGTAVVLNDGTQQRFLRFEDFATDNGPDLNVYLSAAAADAPEGALDDDFVDLGDLKGNIGAQNYEIPTSVDLSRHGTVVIWCVRFGVAFGTAALG